MGLPPKDDPGPVAWTSVNPQGVGPLPTTSSISTGHVTEDPRDKTPLGLFVNSDAFQNFTLFIITLNGIWIGLDVEYNHPSLIKNGKLPLEPASVIIENLFCAYFTVEIILRIIAFNTRNCTDGWFLFDFMLVTFMVIETWILVIIEAIFGGEGGGLLSKFSCLRLLRLTRLTRLMGALPELLTLVRGMLNAARAVTAVLLFMVMIMYIFAIVFTAQIGDPDAPERKLDPYWVRDSDPTSVELFGSMGDSMMTLFTRGLLGDNLAETLQAIKDRAGPWQCEDPDDLETCGRDKDPGPKDLFLMWVFILFMIISAFCVLNMLVGILCEVIDGTAKDEMEELCKLNVHNSIFDSFRAIDLSGDEYVTESEWAPMRNDSAVRESLIGIGVEEEFLDLRLDQMEEHLFGRIDKNKLLDQEDCWVPEKPETGGHKGVPLEEFVSHILEIRPDVPASYLDLEILQTRAERDERVFDAQCDNIERMLWERTNKLNAFRDGGSVLASAANVPKNGTSSAADAWIQGLSTAQLFSELRHRAAVQAGSSEPALYVD